MNKTVVKFGGSNLKNHSDINKIIEVVKLYNNNLIIVVSAFYGVTDLLQKQVDSNKINYKIIDLVFDKYNEVIDLYFTEAEFKALIKNKKEDFISLIKTYLKDKNNLSERNKILSYGERLTSFVLNQILNKRGIYCQEKLPENIGLICNSNLNSAYIPLNSVFTQLINQFSAKGNYIVPGFYCVTKDKQIANFGRGGSDYTAAIIAYAVNAKSLDLWKDVSGFLSADPKLVDNPINIKSLTYLEAAELSYFGAKIIHPGTIRPLIKKNIPLNILDINSTNKNLLKGTTINGKVSKSNKILKSITYNNNFVLLKLKGSGVGIKKGVLRQVTKLFDDANINIRSVITSQIEIDFLLNKGDLKIAKNIINEININLFDVEVENKISLIAGVGYGIKNHSGIAGKIFNALAQKKINIKHIIFGASDVAIYLIVAKEDLKTAINQIHNKIFNN